MGMTKKAGHNDHGFEVPMAHVQDPDQPLQNDSEGPRSIIIAVDASSEAPSVIAAGARISRSARESTIHVVHVFRTSRFDRARAGVPALNPDFLEDAKEHLESLVRSARRQSRSPVVGHFTVGDPTEEILKACRELQADLLVIGTHDHFGLERLLLGSIAETLVRKARCSVLVMRRQGDRR
jgi:nucleotide-binding universal stress UspA family protein